MFIFGYFSLIPLAIIVFGAYHVWLTINAGLSKWLHHWHEDQIKTWSAVTIAVTILIMVAPLLMPTSGLIKEVIFGLYVLYAGTTVVHVVRWWNKRKQNNGSNTPSTQTPPTDKTNKK
jgi:hypothetical protein